MLLDGSMSIADGAVILARRSNASVPEMQRMLEARVRMAHVYDEWKSANTVDSTTSGGVTSSRVNDASHVPPEAFMAALTERGLTKKQAAEAIGRSASRVHELTVRDGGKQHLYDSFVENLDAYLRRVADGEASSGDSKPSDK